MKKIIKYILYKSYNILVFIFLIYLVIYVVGELDVLSVVYTYILVLLLGMIIGFGVSRKIVQLINRDNW